MRWFLAIWSLGVSLCLLFPSKCFQDSVKVFPEKQRSQKLQLLFILMENSLILVQWVRLGNDRKKFGSTYLSFKFYTDSIWDVTLSKLKINTQWTFIMLNLNPTLKIMPSQRSQNLVVWKLTLKNLPKMNYCFENLWGKNYCKLRLWGAHRNITLQLSLWKSL